MTDALLDQYDRLRTRADAWLEAWRGRKDTGSATMTTVLSSVLLGEPVADRIEKRLLLAKAHLEVEHAELGGRLAAAIAALGGHADTAAIEQAVREMIQRVGRVDEGFASKRAELDPLATAYRRLRAALSG
ncbi:MAG: hypothetical protein K1X88_34080 [Nannocystaceae bacterium]|nr:hypothetical protein [Nannocystaceae bacterium]